jgi:hypothetical protein
MAYNFNDQIGVVNGRDINEAIGVQGYDYTHTVVVSGTLAKPFTSEPDSSLTADIYIPIQSPGPTQVGSDRYFTFAPIATDYSVDFGSGAHLATLKGGQTSAEFADSQSGTPVNYLTINSATFFPEINSAESQVSWASPANNKVRSADLELRRPGYRPDQLYASQPL